MSRIKDLYRALTRVFGRREVSRKEARFHKVVVVVSQDVRRSQEVAKVVVLVEWCLGLGVKKKEGARQGDGSTCMETAS